MLAGGWQIRHECRVPVAGRPRHGQSALTPGGHIDADGTALVLVERADGDDLQGLGIQQRVVIADLALAVGLNASQRLEVEGVALSITDVKAQVGGRPVPHGRRSHVRVPAGGHCRSQNASAQERQHPSAVGLTCHGSSIPVL